jgi:hypothetical protein
MTGDPYDYRCPRCHAPLEAPGECGRGPACRTDGEALRDLVAGACSVVLRGARWLGLVK